MEAGPVWAALVARLQMLAEGRAERRRWNHTVPLAEVLHMPFLWQNIPISMPGGIMPPMF